MLLAKSCILNSDLRDNLLHPSLLENADLLVSTVLQRPGGQNSQESRFVCCSSDIKTPRLSAISDGTSC